MSNTDRQIKVAVVGDNCVDVLGPPVNKTLIGGNAINVAVQIARLGVHAHYFGAVGDDVHGRRVAKALQDNGVLIDGLMVRADRPTSVTEIAFTPDGDRQIVNEDFGACDGFACGPDVVSQLAEMDHIHIGWLNDGGALRRSLAALGVSVSQDISVNANPEDLGVAGLTYAFVSIAEPHSAVEDLARAYLAEGAKTVIITRGAEGSSLFSPDMILAQDAKPIEPLDTTGAGDGFIAGLLASILSGESPADALAQARDVAAATCLHAGGFPQDAS